MPHCIQHCIMIENHRTAAKGRAERSQELEGVKGVRRRTSEGIQNSEDRPSCRKRQRRPPPFRGRGKWSPLPAARGARRRQRSRLGERRCKVTRGSTGVCGATCPTSERAGMDTRSPLTVGREAQLMALARATCTDTAQSKRTSRHSAQRRN